MAQYDRVLWEEGMFLGPQHFQQQDRHASQQVHARLKALAPQGQGLCSLQVDETELEIAEAKFALKSVTGIFRDGTAVDAPSADLLPTARPLKDVFGRENGVRVFLAVATARPGVMLEREGGFPGRYRRVQGTLVDDLKGTSERDVWLGELNLRLVFEGESIDGLQVLPLCRVERRAAGGYQIDRKYVPPVLWLAAAPRLCDVVADLVRRLRAISERLTKARATRQGGTGTMTAGEMANYWMCYCLNSSLPLLAHHLSQQRSHPEAVYRDLAALAGALCTFTPAARPQDDPVYDHDALGTVFDSLVRAILERAQVSAPDTCVEIPLRERSGGEFFGQVPDDTLFDTADFCLAVSAKTSQDKIIRDFPNECKLGSPEGVAHVRRYAKKGVRLTHLPSAPPEVPRQAGWHYFAVDSAHPMWQSPRDQGTSSGQPGDATVASVRRTCNVEVYAPLDVYPDLVIEMYAVRRAAR